MEELQEAAKDVGAEYTSWPNPPLYRLPQAGPSRDGPRMLSETRADALPSSKSGKAKEGDVDGRSQRFWRSIKWSPDGTHLLCQAEDHILDLFRLDASDDGSGYTLSHSLSIPLPSPILDFTWYPMARCDEAQSWCFAVSARDVPIRLVDAYSGMTRASYIIVDHTERFVGPHALSFSPDGMCLYAAHVHTLSIFSVPLPTEAPRQLQIIPSRRAPKGVNPGQRGLVSSLAVCQAAHGAGGEEGDVQADLVALGTFAGTVGIYRIPHSSSSSLSSTGGLDFEESLVAGWREKDQAAITQLSFHPAAPWLLLVAKRGEQTVVAHDTRYIGRSRNFRRPPPDTARVGVFERDGGQRGGGGGGNQQRLRFDVDWGGRWLVGGDSQGLVRAWDVRVEGASFEEEVEGKEEGRSSSRELGRTFGNVRAGTQESAGAWSAGKDGVGAVALHPLLPLCATTTGSRHWEEEGQDEDESDDEVSSLAATSLPRPRDAALRLWDLSGH